MFAVATEQLVNSVGSGSLFPIPKMSSAKDFKCFRVIIKRKRELRRSTSFAKPMWEYVFTGQNIDDLLTGHIPQLSGLVHKKPYAEFKEIMVYGVKGSLGLSIAKIMSYEVGEKDRVVTNFQFGKLDQETVDFAGLERALSHGKIDPNNHLLKSTSKDKVLCVITSVVTNRNDVQLSTHVLRDVDTGVDADAMAKAAVNVNIGVENDDNKWCRIDAFTPLAYNVRELHVNKDGAIKLADQECEGGFDKDFDNPLSVFPKESKKKEVPDAHHLGMLPKLYIELNGNLSNDEHKTLLILVRDKIGVRQQEKLETPAALFEELENCGYISASDVRLLVQLFEVMNRPTLVTMVGEFERQQKSEPSK